MNQSFEDFDASRLEHAGFNSRDIFVHPGIDGLIRVEEDFDYSRELEPQLAETQAMFDELSVIYRIPNSGYQPFVMQSEQDEMPRIYIQTSRIEGETLNEVFGRAEHKETINELLTSLSAYLSDKFTQKQPYLGDIYDGEQYIVNEGATLVDVGNIHSGVLFEAFIENFDFAFGYYTIRRANVLKLMIERYEKSYGESSDAEPIIVDLVEQIIAGIDSPRLFSACPEAGQLYLWAIEKSEELSFDE